MSETRTCEFIVKTSADKSVECGCGTDTKFADKYLCLEHINIAAAQKEPATSPYWCKAVKHRAEEEPVRCSRQAVEGTCYCVKHAGMGLPGVPAISEANMVTVRNGPVPIGSKTVTSTPPQFTLPAGLPASLLTNNGIWKGAGHCFHSYTLGQYVGTYCNLPIVPHLMYCNTHTETAEKAEKQSESPKWELNKLRLCTYPSSVRHDKKGREEARFPVKNLSSNSKNVPCGKSASYLALFEEGPCYICSNCLAVIIEHELRTVETIPLGVQAKTEGKDIVLVPYNTDHALFKEVNSNLLVHVGRFKRTAIGYLHQDEVLPLDLGTISDAKGMGLDFLPLHAPAESIIKHSSKHLAIEMFSPDDNMFVLQTQQLVVEHKEANILAVIAKRDGDRCKALGKRDLSYAYKNGFQIMPDEYRSTHAPGCVDEPPAAAKLPAASLKLQVRRFRRGRDLFITNDRNIILQNEGTTTWAVGKLLPNDAIGAVTDFEDITWLGTVSIAVKGFDPNIFAEQKK
jgi:hypothetical protein